MLPKPWDNIGIYFIARVFEKAEVFFSNWPKVWLNARVECTHEYLRRLLRLAKIFHDVCRFTGTRYRGWWYWWFRLEQLGYWGDGKVGARRWLQQRVRDRWEFAAKLKRTFWGRLAKEPVGLAAFGMNG